MNELIIEPKELRIGDHIRNGKKWIPVTHIGPCNGDRTKIHVNKTMCYELFIGRIEVQR